MLKRLPEGWETGLREVSSGFIIRFKDPEMKNKRYRQQKIWISSLSRSVNIWIVFARCNWPGLKTYCALPQGEPHAEAVAAWGAPKETAVSSSVALGTPVCRGVEAGTIRLQA